MMPEHVDNLLELVQNQMTKETPNLTIQYKKQFVMLQNNYKMSTINKKQYWLISGSHGSKYDNDCLLGCYAI